MNMSDSHFSAHGKRRGALTRGEAKTMAGMIAGLSPEPVEAFVLVSVAKCQECGILHKFYVDKSIDSESAMELLAMAIATIIGEEAGESE